MAQLDDETTSTLPVCPSEFDVFIGSGKMSKRKRKCRDRKKSSAANDSGNGVVEFQDTTASSILLFCYDRSSDVRWSTLQHVDDSYQNEETDFVFTDLEERCFELAEAFDSCTFIFSKSRRLKLGKNKPISVFVRQKVRTYFDIKNPKESPQSYDCSKDLKRKLEKCFNQREQKDMESKRITFSRKVCTHLFYWHVQLESRSSNLARRISQNGSHRPRVSNKSTRGFVTASIERKLHVLEEARAVDVGLEKSLASFLIDLQYRDVTPEDYDMLLRLAENEKPKTVSHRKLNSLETTVLSFSPEITELCCICLEPFLCAQRLKILPVCQHRFHDVCIDYWLSEQSTKCPLDGIPV